MEGIAIIIGTLILALAVGAGIGLMLDWAGVEVTINDTGE